MKTSILPLLIFLFLTVHVLGQKTKIVEGLRFTEGPAISPDGVLYFSDVPALRIYKYADDELSVFLEDTGGANGLYFDDGGSIIACAGRARKLISISPDKKVKTLVDSYKGKQLNSPNDLWIHPDGKIYFTDPRYGNTDNLELDGMHVYYFVPESEKLVRVTHDLVRPNGIIGTPNGKVLYVVDQGEEKTYRYDIEPDGTLSGKQLFADVGVDGMTLDEKENVYITHQKTVQCYSPKGELLKTFPFEAMTTNVVFHEDGLFVTTQAGEVFWVELK